MSSNISNKNIKTGPRGGQYYIKNGKKVYIKSAPVTITKQREKKGCSNAGKYKDVPNNLFCGPFGGACKGTYPVTSKKQAISALAYAHKAPNPDGIRKCVYRLSKKNGWGLEPGKK